MIIDNHRLTTVIFTARETCSVASMLPAPVPGSTGCGKYRSSLKKPWPRRNDGAATLNSRLEDYIDGENTL